MEIKELQGKISALDKSSKLLDQKFVSLVENYEKCNNMLEIISEANALKSKSEEQLDDMKKTWGNIKTFKREQKEASEFLFEVFKIYLFGPSIRLIVAFLNQKCLSGNSLIWDNFWNEKHV